MTQTLDNNLIDRYTSVCDAHPFCQLSFPDNRPMSDLDRAARGELVHLMRCHNGILEVRWVEASPALRFIFDAYAI